MNNAPVEFGVRDPRISPRAGDMLIVFDAGDKAEIRTVVSVNEKSVHYRLGDGPGKWMFLKLWRVLAARPGVKAIASPEN